MSSHAPLFQQLFLELDEDQFPDAEELMEIMSNVHLNTNFQSLARELDIMEPKVGFNTFSSHIKIPPPANYWLVERDSSRFMSSSSVFNLV